MRRSATAVVIAAISAATALGFSAGPAAAGGCNGSPSTAPDARLFDPDSGWDGGGAYPVVFGNTFVGAGQAKSFEAQWRNMSEAVQTIRVRGLEFVKEPGMRIKLFVKGVNVTSRFRGDGNGLTFHDVAPGKRTSTIEIRFRNVSDGAPEGQQILIGFYKGVASTELCDSAHAGANIPA